MIFRQFFQIMIICVMAFWPEVVVAKESVAPEPATGFQIKKAASGNQIMAVTAHPDATKVAYNILKAGGTAADAGIAAQMVLGLVEPQSSGIGGGGFALYYDAQRGHLVSLDGRETAPSIAGPHLFTEDGGKPMAFYDAANGGRSVGVPGLLRMLGKLHEWQGRMEWRDLFLPAMQLANDGFIISERLNKMLMRERNRFDVDTEAKLYFYPDTSNPLKAGTRVRNTKYSQIMQRIAMQGVDSFYNGKIAENIVAKTKEHPTIKGLLSIEDMKNYRAIERKTICGFYRGYKICSMNEPSSGGLTLLQILGILENFDLKNSDPKNPVVWHIISEASRLAFADRNQYIADSDFVLTPGSALLDQDYLKQRADLIDPNKAMMEVNAGQFIVNESAYAPDERIKNTGTTHMSIRDAYGNILSMTTSIENAFGSRLMVDGFLLNNQLTDFSFKPNDDQGNPVANRVEGNKRPRSSMAPTIIFDPSGEPFMVIGSAGGSRIIGYILQRIIAVIDWDIELQEAMNMPNILHRGKKLEVESTALEYAEPLKNLGHAVLVGDMNSGLTAIQFKDGKIIGAADPRRDGMAIGE
jgi:gamma-glutamyltranspeptidase/glutathione hydrolase